MREQVMTMHYQQSFRLFSGWRMNPLKLTISNAWCTKTVHTVENIFIIISLKLAIDHSFWLWPQKCCSGFQFVAHDIVYSAIVWTKMYVQICAHCSKHQLLILLLLLPIKDQFSIWSYWRFKWKFGYFRCIWPHAFGDRRRHRWYVWRQRKN